MEGGRTRVLGTDTGFLLAFLAVNVEAEEE